MPEERPTPTPNGSPDPITEDGAEPVLRDPYLVPPEPPPAPARPRLSRLAVASLVAAPLGPVATALALGALRSIERSAGTRRGRGLATAGMTLGVLSTFAWGAFAAYLAITHVHRVDPAGDEPVVLDEPGRPPPTSPPLSPPPPRSQTRDLTPWAPRHTVVKREGAITVVDLGADTPKLEEELAKQRADAQEAGETLVLMTTARACEPCRGVDRSLSDPRLQAALAKVRLVRVDIVSFHEELDGLRVPHDGIPGFFLLAPDLGPRDGIDGGEWDDDIPANIAPVLGPFLRGKYTKRRRPWTAPPTSGITL